MKIRYLKDVIIYGSTHKKEEENTLDGYDKIYTDSIGLCIGHGHYHTLKIGEDIEIINEIEKLICPMCRKHVDIIPNIDTNELKTICKSCGMSFIFEYVIGFNEGYNAKLKEDNNGKF